MHGLDRRVAGSLVLLAVLVRAAAVLALQSHTVPRSTFEHGEIAANLLAGRGFSVMYLGADGPTSQQAPLYPFIVAGAYAIGGVETPRSLLLLELAQSLLGGLLVLGVLRLAGEVAPGRRGLALFAGAIAALHPTLVYAATHVQVALPAAVLLVWSLAMGYRAGRTGRDRDALMTGFLLALLALTDPILALSGVGVLAAVALGRGSWRLSPRPIGLLLLAAAVGIAPWTVRNAVVHGELMFVKDTFGYAFWQGNCALSQGTDKVVRASVEPILAERGEGLKGWNESLWKARHEAGYLDDIALSKSDYAMLGALPEPARARVLFRWAMRDIQADPGRYGSLCLRRLRYFLLFDETNPKTRNVIYRASHLGLSLLAVVGLWVMPRDLRRRLWPTFLVVAVLTLFHALTIVSARFHIPIEPLLGLWAGGLLARVGSAAAAAPGGDGLERFRVVPGRLGGEVGVVAGRGRLGQAEA